MRIGEEKGHRGKNKEEREREKRNDGVGECEL